MFVNINKELKDETMKNIKKAEELLGELRDVLYKIPTCLECEVSELPPTDDSSNEN